MRLTVHDIALAAYLKANGAVLVEAQQERTWVFESDRPASEWRLEYSNSCCRKHDRELLELRRLSRSSDR